MTSLKRRTFEIVEKASSDDLPSKIFDVYIIGLILLNVSAVILESVNSLSAQYGPAFRAFEVFSVASFTVEYLLRLWSSTADDRYRRPISGRLRFALTPMSLVDLLAVLPFYLPLILILDLRFIRAIRLFRLFRLFKTARYSHAMTSLSNVLRAKKEEILIAGFMVLILLVFASSLMYYVEHEAQPKAFADIPTTLWWGVATLTTVGYGDVYPITPLGKVFSAIITILGIGLFALPTGILAAGFTEEIQKRQPNTEVCPNCGVSLAPVDRDADEIETTSLG